VLDFGKPTTLMLVAVLHFIPDEDKPAEIIATLLDALPAGSYLVASHGVSDHDPEGPVRRAGFLPGVGDVEHRPQRRGVRPAGVQRA